MAEEPANDFEKRLKQMRQELINYKNTANHVYADLQHLLDCNEVSTIYKAFQKYPIDRLINDLHFIQDSIKTIEERSRMHAETKLDTDVKELKIDKHSKAQENIDVTVAKEETGCLHLPVDADDNGTSRSQGLSLESSECIKTRETPGRVKPVDSGFSSVGSSVMEAKGQFNSFAISAVLDTPVQEQDDVQGNTEDN